MLKAVAATMAMADTKHFLMFIFLRFLIEIVILIA
jgi:hypothetical protein